PAGTDFVGGHPMAGSEESGYEAARPELFAGAAWALVGEGEPAARVARLVRALGAAPVACDATAHDRVVALTSHLPQLLATALAAELETVAAAGEPLAAALLGPGGRDFLRLAGGSFAVWGDILEHNRAEVERALEGVRGRATLPAAALEEEFAAARRFAARLADRRPVIARSGATKQSRR
ncbi:MAG TPA: prephenate dehydrogenase/arogenate dehydrogenase family protein, partial [Thermoanaerobaculia bacterium]|nr:prephenate dehydrogenase/arogenate dehydrogenase family protein [Thermoanaerobaculia bacterium]